MESAGIGDSLLAASIQYILNVVMTIPAILFLDKWGRRPTLLLGSFAMMVFLFSVGALEAVYGHEQHSDSGPLAAINWVLKDDTTRVAHTIVALTYLFVIAFAMTWVRLPPLLHLHPAHFVGAHLLDLPFRDLPLANPRESRLTFNRFKLGLEHRYRLCCTATFVRRQLEGIHVIWVFQRPRFDPHVRGSA